MTQYHSLNVNLSNSQLNKLKSAITNETEEVLRLSSNTIGDNFLHKLLLTNRQVANLRKAFANYLLTNIKLSKTQLSKMIQSVGFLGRLLGPLLKTGLPLIKNIIKPLAKSVLIPLGLTKATSAAYAGMHEKILGSGNTAAYSSRVKSMIFYCVILRKKQWVAKQATELNRVVLFNIQTRLKAAVLQTVKTGKERLCDTILSYSKK